MLPLIAAVFPLIKTSPWRGQAGARKRGASSLCRGLCRYSAGKGMMVFTNTSKLGFYLPSGFHLLSLWMVLLKATVAPLWSLEGIVCGKRSERKNVL